MIEAKDLTSLSTDQNEAVTKLAERVYGKPAEELTNNQIVNLLRLEMEAYPCEMTISVGEVRPTSINYSTSRYDATIKIDMNNTFDTAEKIMEESDNPIAGLIESVLLARAFILDKYTRTEAMLRNMVNDAIKADGLQTPPETRAAKV